MTQCPTESSASVRAEDRRFALGLGLGQKIIPLVALGLGQNQNEIPRPRPRSRINPLVGHCDDPSGFVVTVCTVY